MGSGHMTTSRPLFAREVQLIVGTVLVAATCAGIGKNLRDNADLRSTWNVGEWLINYSDGFIRRGLPGSLIYLTSQVTGISPVRLILGLSIVGWLGLVFIFVRASRAILPWNVMFSPLLLLTPILGDFLVRKDSLLLALFGVILTVSQSRQLGNLCRVSLISVLLVAGILSHESFFFLAAPATVFMVHRSQQFASDYRTPPGTSWKFALLPGMASATALASTWWWSGSRTQAQGIWESWRNLSLESGQSASITIPEEVPIGSIHSLGLSMRHALSMSFSVINDTSGWFWVPLAWAMTVTCGAWIILSSLRVSSIERRRATKVFVLHLASMAPLFALGWDFGRWISSWLMGSTLLLAHLLKETRQRSSSLLVSANRFHRTNARLTPLLLITAVPTCCWSWSGYWNTSPVGYLLEIL